MKLYSADEQLEVRLESAKTEVSIVTGSIRITIGVYAIEDLFYSFEDLYC